MYRTSMDQLSTTLNLEIGPQTLTQIFKTKNKQNKQFQKKPQINPRTRRKD